MDHQTIAQPPEAVKSRKRRGRVRLFANWCKDCGICVAFCPQHVFDLDSNHHPVVARPEDCIACQWCVIHCPDFAIWVELIPPDAEDPCP